MNARHFGKRTAISPVLATVVLIAITLVSGISMASFSFGIFNTYTSNASVAAVGVSCVHGTQATSACMVRMQNTGQASTVIASCSLSGASSTASGTMLLTAGGTWTATCTGAPSNTEGGEYVQGMFILSNGLPVPFTGIYQ